MTNRILISSLALASLFQFIPPVVAVSAPPRAAPAPQFVAVTGPDRTAALHPPQTVPRSHLRALPRSANGRDYLLYVSLPASYDQSPTKHYPVLYLCDGYWDFNLVTSFLGNLLYDQVIPEFIVVGIGYQGENPNVDALRAYDYTPVPDPAQDPAGKNTGHAPEFLAVVAHEIIPFVEREYRADSSYRALGGSSYGGIFTLYTLFTSPGLFQAYIVPSPAVLWANEWIFGYEESFAKSGQSPRARLFMTGASAEWPHFLEPIQRFNARLRTRAYPTLEYEWRLIDGERHAGTKAESYNRGVRHAFAPLVKP